MATKEKIINVTNIEQAAKTMNVIIEGDSDLVLNKMDDVTARELADIRKDKKKNVLEEVNEWEKIITSVHWLYGKPDVFSEKTLQECLKNNKPCITAFGLMKSFCEAVVRNSIDKYATKLKATMNVTTSNGLIPIEFTEHYLDEKLMSPQRGKPVLSRLHRFTGWSAVIPVSFLENSYSQEQLVNIINLAGFGGGIGSGRTSGYGRYHVIGLE